MHGYPDLLPGPPGLRPHGPPHDLMYHGPPPDHLLPPHDDPHVSPAPLLLPPDGQYPGSDIRQETGAEFTYLDTSDDSGRHTGPDQPSP